MRKITRARRAELQRRAQHIRRQGQRAEWSVERIATAILANLPDVLRLEAWRYAYGWSRAEVVAGIGNLYQQQKLAVPAINSSMLCRWEHGATTPGPEYSSALCRLYQAYPDQLGLAKHCRSDDRLNGNRGIDVTVQAVHRPDSIEKAGGEGEAGLQAVRGSILFALELEGPAGGPSTLDCIGETIQYYALKYSIFPAGVLAAEVHRCRDLVIGMMNHPQSNAARTELRRHGGWLSALLGNLAFHHGDNFAAEMHLSIATSLAENIGYNRLIAWSAAAQSMLARYQNRPTLALDLAHRAVAHADSPLRRSQAIAWAELPALARLGRRSDTKEAITAAQREMDLATDFDHSGRFGFDYAELELHLAETQLLLGNISKATQHAHTSLAHTTYGRPSWAAAVLTLAQIQAEHRQPNQAAELGLQVLSMIPPPALRETSRRRLTVLDNYLTALERPGTAAVDLHERLRNLPPR
jgi:hypothetical protein